MTLESNLFHHSFYECLINLPHDTEFASCVAVFGVSSIACTDVVVWTHSDQFDCSFRLHLKNFFGKLFSTLCDQTQCHLFCLRQRKKKIERKNKIWKINSTQLSSLVTRLSRRWERVRGAPHLVFTKKLTSLSLFSLTHIHFSIFFRRQLQTTTAPGSFSNYNWLFKSRKQKLRTFFWRARHSILSDLNTSALKCWKWPDRRGG